MLAGNVVTFGEENLLSSCILAQLRSQCVRDSIESNSMEISVDVKAGPGGVNTDKDI